MAVELDFSQNDVQIIEDWEMETIPLGELISNWPEEIEASVDKIIMGYLPIRKNNEYWGLAQAKELGFTVMHSHQDREDFWTEQMNTAYSLNMKCLIQVPEHPEDEGWIKQYIQNLKEHPALWGWISYDDVDYKKITKENQIKLYDLIKRYDNEHPVGVTACSTEWEAYLEPKAFDILFYQVYAYRDAIVNPDEWLDWMCDRLGDFDLIGKRIIPVIQSFGPRGDFHTAHIEYTYNLVKSKLKIRSCACWDWQGIVEHSEYRTEVRKINQDL